MCAILLLWCQTVTVRPFLFDRTCLCSSYCPLTLRRVLRLKPLTLSRRHQEVIVLLSRSPAALCPCGLDKVTARCFYRLLCLCFSSRDGLNSPHLLLLSSMGLKKSACLMRKRSHKSGPDQKQVCHHKHTPCRTPPTGCHLLQRAY